MVRLFLTVVAGLALLTAKVSRPANGGEGVKLDLDAKANLGLVVKLKVPRNMKFADIHKITQKGKARGATTWSVQVLKAGDELLAEVVVRPPMPSKRVASVVEELLDSGCKKISIEMKK